MPKFKKYLKQNISKVLFSSLVLILVALVILVVDLIVSVFF